MSSKEPDISQKESIVTNTYHKQDGAGQNFGPFSSSFSPVMHRGKAGAKWPAPHLSLCGGD